MQATEPSASSSSDTTIESVPELVWHAIWVRLSYCSRQNVRIASRALRCRSDASLDAIYTGRHSPEAVCSLGSAAWRCETPLTNAGNACNSALCIGGAPSPNHSRVLPKTMQREIPAIPGTATSTAPTTSQPPVRFPQLRHLALAPPPARPAPCSSPNLPPYLHTFHAPGPAALLLAFLPAPQLSHLLLLDLPPTLSEADLRTIASRCPSLRSLHFVAPRTPAGRSLALPPLASLAACSQLRELSLDLGRSAVAGPAARRSLGALTQLTRLQLTVSDTGGEDEDAVDSLVRRRPAAARGLRDVGEDGEDAAAVAAAATGGLVGSLFRLAAAGLSSLELRLVGVGTVECALLRAVGAGAALYERQRSARAAAPAAEGCVGRSAYGGSTPMGVNDPQTLATSSSCGRSPLQHLCVRLLPNSSPDASAYGSGSGPMYGSTPPHALYSCTAPVSGGGTHGSAFPLASLSYGPHPLGAGSGGGVDGGVGGVAWLQPSESESLLGCLAALPALTSIEVRRVAFHSSKPPRPSSHAVRSILSLVAIRSFSTPASTVLPYACFPYNLFFKSAWPLCQNPRFPSCCWLPARTCMPGWAPSRGCSTCGWAGLWPRGWRPLPLMGLTRHSAHLCPTSACPYHPGRLGHRRKRPEVPRWAPCPACGPWPSRRKRRTTSAGPAACHGGQRIRR